MSWIKRNLYFFIGSVVALVLMGLAGYFLYAKWSLNNEYFEKLNSTSAELKSLNSKSPHPGNREVDNIKLAKEQREQLGHLVKKVKEYNKPIPPIPDVPKVSDVDFSTALIQTIVDLQKQATNAGITLPSDYAFSFQAQRIRISFVKGSVPPLAVQLGEVKSMCDILFAARINALDNIRRDRIGKDDDSGPQTDYLTEKSITNDMAILTQYEVTFRSFSAELGAVLGGFASSPYGWVVKTINVEPAPANTASAAPDPASQYYPPPAVPQYYVSGGRMPGGLRDGYGFPVNSANSYPGTVPVKSQPPTLVSRGGLPTVLDEKQLKITLNVVLIKLLPTK